MLPINHFSSLLNQDQRATALYLFDVGCGSDVVDELGWVAFALVAGDGDSTAVADLSCIVVVRVGFEAVDFRLHGGDTGVGVRHGISPCLRKSYPPFGRCSSYSYGHRIG